MSPLPDKLWEVTMIGAVASGVGSGAIAVQQVHQYLSGRDGRR